MNAVVVYESLFGNTERVAKAVAKGLGHAMEVSVVEVEERPSFDPGSVDLLVVGGPTHAHGMSRPGTRKTPNGAGQGIGVREWLEALAPAPGLRVATFDTRFDKPRWLTGSAARSIRSRLVRKGCRPIAEAESFFVVGTEGPLRDRELVRAAGWGAELATRARRGLETRAD